MCDTELIGQAYLKLGEDCVNHLIGDFVFVFYDRRAKKVFCGRDHLGVRPFYYNLTEDGFICATSLPPLMQFMDRPARVGRQWIVDYLTGLSKSFDQTPFLGIKKLPPGHTFAVSPDRHRLRSYFTLSTEPELNLNDSGQYVEAYREQLETAVRRRLDTTYALGSELSGGLDSSTVTAYAAKFFDRPLSRLHAFALANTEMEPWYILAVSQAFGLPHTHVVAGHPPDQDEVMERSLKVLGYPVEHENATYHEPFYRLAETFGIRTLLSGFGGDEFGTTIHGYMVPLEMMLKHRYGDLLNILPGNPFFRFLRLAKMYLRKIRTRDFTLPEYSPRFLAAWKSRWPHQIVSRSMTEAYNLKARYFDQARFDAGYTDLKKFILENRWAPFVPTRLENCTLMAAARNIEYRWPLLDVGLVSLFLRIPSEENYFRGMGRYLHRRAVDGVVPKIVTWKKSKDMGNLVRSDFHGELSVGPSFVDELHPELKDMVDPGKLTAQVRTMDQCETPKNRGLFFQIKRNIRNLKIIDYWLKQNLFSISS